MTRQVCGTSRCNGDLRSRAISLREAEKWIRKNGIEDFEGLDDVKNRQRRMLLNFHKNGLNNAKKFSDCNALCCSERCRSDACHYSSRRLRLMGISSAAKVLTDDEEQKYLVSVIIRASTANRGGLHTLSASAIRKQMQQRLRRAGVTLAVGSFEVCLNSQLDGSAYWSGGVHFVCAGVGKRHLHNALRVAPWPECARPVDIRPIENVTRCLGYVLKRLPQERRQYVDKNGRKNRRKMPLHPQHQLEHDVWLAGHPPGGLTILVGLRRTADGSFRLV